MKKEFIVGVIDDDMVSQFATLYVIEQSKYPCKILNFDSAETALASFMETSSEGRPLPDIIILDLSMPGMNGWEFLEKYETLSNKDQKTEMYILSAFSNAKDRLKAKENPSIHGYFDKPLSKENLEQIFVSKTV